MRLQKIDGNVEALRERTRQIEDMLELRRKGVSVEKIAVKYEVSAGCINRILRQNGMK